MDAQNRRCDREHGQISTEHTHQNWSLNGHINGVVQLIYKFTHSKHNLTDIIAQITFHLMFP